MGRRGAETHLPLCDYIFFYVDRSLLTLTGLGSIRITRGISGGSDSFSVVRVVQSGIVVLNAGVSAYTGPPEDVLIVIRNSSPFLRLMDPSQFDVSIRQWRS